MRSEKPRSSAQAASSTLSNEELLVIEKSQVGAAGKEMPIPGGGTLAAEVGGKMVTVPLKHTEVSAEVSGYIASVGVVQQFENPYSEKIEATYVFPLPQDAGVNDFVMTIGDRHIRGIIREREEARKIYEEAKSQGYVASLMTQERPNIFTQNVANIEPGKRIDVSIRYFHTLTYKNGWYEWVYPMVVGPRYNPAGSTDGVGAVAKGNQGASGQKTEVQYLHPTERSGHDIGLTVKVDAGMKIAEMASVNHIAHRRDDGEGGAVVTLDATDAIPNKDFVLRWKVAGESARPAMFVHKDKDGKGGTFSLMIVPPESLASLPRRPLEMVFVVDTSGSMSGRPIAQAKAAVQVALGKMHADDTFQIVKFANSADQLFPTAMPATAENVVESQKYVKAMQGDGGTEMLTGINKAMDFPRDPNRTRVVAFLTDGYIGNEVQILKALHQKLEGGRVFSFGVGTSVNRYLLDWMAVVGQGDAAYLSLNEAPEPVMDAYFEKISHPALANVKVECKGMEVTDVYPRRIPELFVGRPIVIAGRFKGAPTGEVVVSGKVGGKEGEAMKFVMSPAGRVTENAGINTVWARMKIADLELEGIWGERNVSQEVKNVALEHGLMSAYTSFIAVDSTRKTEGDHGTTVAVPVPVPEGVRYDTTVQERRTD